MSLIPLWLNLRNLLRLFLWLRRYLGLRCYKFSRSCLRETNRFLTWWWVVLEKRSIYYILYIQCGQLIFYLSEGRFTALLNFDGFSLDEKIGSDSSYCLMGLEYKIIFVGVEIDELKVGGHMSHIFCFVLTENLRHHLIYYLLHYQASKSKSCFKWVV